MFPSTFPKPNSWLLLSLTLLCVVGFAGCKPPEADVETSDAPAKPEISEYPLRVWIAAEVSDASRIERQWLAGSEQPIEIRVLNEAELLAGESCGCDLLMFPARLLGELVHREWIVKLPSAVGEVDEGLEVEMAGTTPAAEAQADYGGVPYAVSLGCSMPVVIASSNLYQQLGESSVSWNQITDSLSNVADCELPPTNLIDRQALVDRFLTIAAGMTDRDPNYGLLFELQTMTPRLAQPEFVQAGKILKSLSLQKGGVLALVGSHDEAWQFATQHSESAVAIAAPALINEENSKIKTGGGRLQVGSPGTSSGWNVGGGVVAALAADCRQTSLTVGMLKWLRQKKTLASLGAVIAGVESPAPTVGVEALSWRIRNELGAALGNAKLPKEPRMVSADAYRAVLADELLSMLSDEKTVDEALSDAAAAWSTIIPQAEFDVQADYEKSLGLTL